MASIFVFFGLIASGKSTLAKAWAREIEAVYYNSDVVRKELVGLQPQADQRVLFDEGIYAPEFSRKTYDTLLKCAATEVGRGKMVVLDASYQSVRERLLVKDMARRLGHTAIFIQCSCPEDEMKKRMVKRARNPNAVSDGRWEIYLAQKEKFVQPKELTSAEVIHISTDKSVTLLVSNLVDLLKR